MFRDIHGRLKAYGGVECAISGCGILVLAAAYLYWLVAEDAGPVGRLAALLSLAHFIWMCLRFVPVWVSAWHGNGLEVQADAERESAAELLKIFALLLLFCLGMTLLVWLIRLLQATQRATMSRSFTGRIRTATTILISRATATSAPQMFPG